jgi:hypothetical protein
MMKIYSLTFSLAVVVFSFLVFFSTEKISAQTCRNGDEVNSVIKSLPSPDREEAIASFCSGERGGVEGSTEATANESCEVSGSFFGLPTWYKYLETERDSTGRCSPVLSGGDEEGTVNSSLLIGIAVLEAMIRLAGVVAVVMIFVAGFRFITSQGNPDAAAAARKTAINALIGLVIVVLATTIVSFVGSSLSNSDDSASIRSSLS